MGNAIVRQDSDVSDHQIAIPPRKHSTVSQAKLLLMGPPPIEYVTEEQKIFIRTSWKIIEADIARVGVITFIQLFETHPDVKDVFMPFNGMKVDELQHSKQLRAHALRMLMAAKRFEGDRDMIRKTTQAKCERFREDGRVMGFVQKVVARLDEKEKLDKLLEELGKAHFYYGAPKKYIDQVGPHFLKAIEPSLKEIWSSDLKESWTQLFAYISYQMKNALTAAEKAKRGSK